MSTRMRAPAGTRKFKVRVERAANDSYTATIAAVDDAQKIIADAGLDSGIMDLVNDILIEIVREGDPPDGHD